MRVFAVTALGLLLLSLSACPRAARPEEPAPPAVLPRPVLSAVPRDAEAVLFAPTVKGKLAQAVDFTERAAGQLTVGGLAEREPFFRYALELSAGPPPEDLALDPAEGLAVFVLPDQPGTLVTVGVLDEARALSGLQRWMAQAGFAARPLPDNALAFENADGRQSFGFADRGYLYVASTYRSDANGPDPHQVMQQIRAGDERGLSQDARLVELRAKVTADAPLFLYVPSKERALFAALKFTPEQLKVEGALAASAPVWRADGAPDSVPLERASPGPVLALSASLSPDALPSLLRSVGMTAENADELARGLDGDVAVTAYFDARGTVEQMAREQESPSVQGSVVVKAGVRDRAAVEAFLSHALQEAGAQVRRRRAADATTFVGRWYGRKVDAQVTDARLDLVVGPPRDAQRVVPLAQSLRERFGQEAFSRGHLSALVDVGQLSRDLEGQAPPGGESAPEALMGFVAVFIQEATDIDTVFVDVAPEPWGGRVRAEIRLRARP